LKRARLEARLIVAEAVAEAAQHRILAIRETYADAERLRNEVHQMARGVLEDARTDAAWILSKAHELVEAEVRAATAEATLKAQRAQAAPKVIVKQVRRDAAVSRVQSTIDAEAVLAWRRDAELFAEYDEQAIRGAAAGIADIGAEYRTSARATEPAASDFANDPAADGAAARRAAWIADLETVLFDTSAGDVDGADVGLAYPAPVEHDEFWDSPLAGPSGTRHGRRLFLGLLAVAVGFGLTLGGIAVAQGRSSDQQRRAPERAQSDVRSTDRATTTPTR
jgi:hypothetical protein